MYSKTAATTFAIQRHRKHSPHGTEDFKTEVLRKYPDPTVAQDEYSFVEDEDDPESFIEEPEDVSQVIKEKTPLTKISRKLIIRKVILSL